MQKRTLVLILSLLLSVFLTCYYAWKFSKIESNLISVEQELNNEKARHNKTELYQIDSILLKGNYKTALSAYRELENLGNDALSNDLNTRIKMVNKIITLQNELIKVDTLQNDSLSLKLDSISKEIHLSYLRKLDSTDFAISKAQMQIENLKTQLKNKSGEGYIKFTNAKGKIIYYVGETQKQTAHGKGVGLYESGSRYEGEWFHNKRHGLGKFYWPDGEKYEGAYLNDKRDGFGTYYWPNGEMYRGQWKEDYRSGKGVFFGADGEVIAKGIWKQDELIEVNKD